MRSSSSCTVIISTSTLGIKGFKRLDARDARHAWQADVEERHGRRVARSAGKRRLHRSISPHTSEAGRSIDEARQPFADVALVLDDEHADRV